jgi:hypothetical protein
METNCPVCEAPCVYKYCTERAHEAFATNEDTEFLKGYRKHARLVAIHFSGVFAKAMIDLERGMISQNTYDAVREKYFAANDAFDAVYDS